MAEKQQFSPMMQRYLETKEQYKDCILFYRLGDFYEMFFDDAILASRELEITLTGKDCGQEERAPMAGVPHHAAEMYIAKLVAKGYKVAICEQLSDPKTTKGIVERGVIRVVTPGTIVESNMLEERKNNYIMSIYKAGIYFGISVCDISTGEFYSAEIKDTQNFPMVLDEIARYAPSELVINSMLANCNEEIDKIKERFENIYITKYNDKFFDTNINSLNLRFNILDTSSKKVENMEEKVLAVASINALIQYIEETQKTSLDHINKITFYTISRYMALDINARRNLELTEKMRDKSKKGTLLWVLDKTSTSMGGRLLRRWISDPLIDVLEINKRLNAVKELKDNIILKGDITEALKKVYDIERLAGKMAYGNANARDMITLKNSLLKLPEVKQLLSDCKSDMLKELYENLDELQDIYSLIEKSIVDDPPMTVKDGGIIKLGYDEEIDKLKTAQTEGKNWLIQLEADEKEKTGIKNLKVGFNKVFGYFIEVTKSNLDQVPERYIRKQTIANAERYTTEDLQKIEDKIFNSAENAIKLEEKLYKMLLDYLSNYLSAFADSAKIIAEIDALLSLSLCAVKYGFCKPVINKNIKKINIVDGRHPIVERFVKDGSFIANDTLLDDDENKMMIITGPNMAGKSTYMRQVAIITFLAHIGSFVPAKSAEISITDRIFTRVGASDDLAFGQSTFMVEMSEVANILLNATDKSLVVLDEIGRGTSTFDGLSIAWAVVEYIAKNLKCKTLFATHYHELSELEGVIKGVKNYKITVKEINDTVVFLRKIVRGHASKSFGVEVAQLAGVPQKVIDRAKEISLNLEKVNTKLDMNIFGEDEERTKQEKNNKLGQKLLSILRDMDINRMSPIESFEVLNDLITKAKTEE